METAFGTQSSSAEGPSTEYSVRTGAVISRGRLLLLAVQVLSRDHSLLRENLRLVLPDPFGFAWV